MFLPCAGNTQRSKKHSCFKQEENVYDLLGYFNGADIGITLLRLGMGLFFTISGYHKLFNPVRHATVAQTMVEDHIPEPVLNSWAVPAAEFVGGIALLIGLLTSYAAFGLFVICCGATLT